MKKIKKLASIFLAVLLVFSMTAVSIESVSAIIDSNGCYAPGDNVKCGTHRYYFAMPSTWLNEYTDTAGVYWWNIDVCGLPSDADLVNWPGYKAHRGGYQNSAYGVYYVDCPKDVTSIIWNNYIDDDGASADTAMSNASKQTNGVSAEFYSKDDSEIYSNKWFAEMEASYNGDKKALGSYADNFFYDELYNHGFSFNFNNMIFVANPTIGDGTSSLMGESVYEGEWYFYYGCGEYGTYPTKEGSKANGTLKNLAEGAVFDFGDVNLDGKLTVADATLIQKYIAGIEEFAIDEQFNIADINQDGEVNIFDATAIQCILAGR